MKLPEPFRRPNWSFHTMRSRRHHHFHVLQGLTFEAKGYGCINARSSFVHICPILSLDLQPCVILFGIQVCILHEIIASMLSFDHWWCHRLILTIRRNLDTNGFKLIRNMIWWTCPNLSGKGVLNQMQDSTIVSILIHIVHSSPKLRSNEMEQSGSVSP